LREFISREGKKYDTPQHQAQRKMKMKQLEKLIEVENVEEDSDMHLRLPQPYSNFDKNATMIAIKDVGFAWESDDAATEPSEEEYLFRNVDFTVGSGARIVILGKNGCGKTSLLNLLTGEVSPSVGDVQRHVGSRVTMLQQHHYKGEQLDPNISALDHIKAMNLGAGMNI
jgi:ATPase subunit of ABC transporter with duplicated ATPase domains